MKGNGVTRASDSASAVLRACAVDRRRLLHLVVLCFLMVAGLLLPAEAAKADASDGDVGAEEAKLFEDLLAGASPGEWRGVLNAIVEKQKPVRIRRTLGPLFRSAEVFTEHPDCAAFTAAYLADHPVEDKALLGDTVVLAAHGDGDFIRALRSHITRGEGGWERLLDHARVLFASDNLVLRRAAIYFLSHEAAEQRQRVREELLAAAKRDLDVVAQGRNGPGGLSAEYLAAFQRMFGYRFVTLDEAVQSLDALADRDLAGLVLALSQKKDAPDTPTRLKVIDYGKRLVDEVVTTGRPKAMAEFLDADLTPYPEVRRYAIEKAGQMSPAADAVWGQLLRNVLSRESDPGVLHGTLTLLERTGFAGVPEVAPRLTAALALRLRRGGGDIASGRDALEDRVRMARLIGTLRVRPPEFDALLAAEAELESEVLAELVRALGGVSGVKTDELLALYLRHGEAVEKSRSVRTAVVDALGRAGIRADEAEGAAAADALAELLTGQGGAGLGRSEDSDIRQHAVRSLGSHAGPATTELLRLLATAEDEAEARVSIVVLRKIAARDGDAVRALGEVAGASGLTPERRTLALEALTALGAKGAADLPAAQDAARAVLTSDAPDELRLIAARAVAALGDGRGLEPLLSFWEAAPDPERRAALDALLAALVAAGDPDDAAVGRALWRIGEQDGWDAAAALSRTLVEAHPRAGLTFARAKILHERAGVPDRSLEDRRKDVAEAELLIDTLLGPAPEADPWSAQPLRVHVLRRAGELAEDDAERRDRYLEAVHNATLAGGEDMATLGLSLVDLLNTPPLQALLTPEQVGRLNADRAVLESRLGG